MQLLKGINLFLSALPLQSIVHNQISSLENFFVHGDSVQAHNNQVWIEFSNIKDTCTSKDYPKISISIRKSTKPRHIQTCLAIFSSRFCAIELFIDFISLTCIYLVTGKFSESDFLWVACMGWSSQRDVFSQNVTNRRLKARDNIKLPTSELATSSQSWGWQFWVCPLLRIANPNYTQEFWL